MIPIPGDDRYTHHHHYDAKAPKCGLALGAEFGGGACRIAAEPGLPWCNFHFARMFKQLQRGSYQPEQARAYFASLGWTADAVEAATRRYERDLTQAGLAPVAVPPEAPASPTKPAGRTPRTL